MTNHSDIVGWQSVVSALRAESAPKAFSPRQLDRVSRWHRATPKQRNRWKHECKINYRFVPGADPEFEPVTNGFYMSLADQLEKWLSTDPDARQFPNPFSVKQWKYVLKVMPESTKYLYDSLHYIDTKCPVCFHEIRQSTDAVVECRECTARKWDTLTCAFIEVPGRNPQFMPAAQVEIFNTPPDPEPEPEIELEPDILLDDSDDIIDPDIEGVAA